MNKRRIGEIPRVRMGGINPAEGGEELAPFQLQVKGQAGGLQECFFGLDAGLIIVVELEDDIGETFEVGIDRAVKSQLDVPSVEAALLRVVVAYLHVVKIARARAGQSKHRVEGDV